MIDIGKWLKVARLEKKMTKKELSKRSGYALETIYKIETSSSRGNWETVSNLIESLGYEIRIVKNGCSERN